MYRARGQPSNSIVYLVRFARGGERNRYPRRIRNPGESSSRSEGVHRRASVPMRVLPERLGHDRESVAGQKSQSDGGRNQERAGGLGVSVWQPCANPSRRAPRVRKGEERLSNMALPIPLSRRQFLKDSGGLLIGFSLADSAVLPQLLGEPSPETVSAPSPGRLDSWLRIEKDGSIRVFTGKAEIGMGVETALIQIVAEELDVSPERVAFIMGDTAMTADQGGVGGSTSIMLGSKPLRNAAVTARFLLLRLASRRLDVPPDRLQVRNGIVSVQGEASRSVSYGDLVGGSGLNDALSVSGEGFSLDVEGKGKPKDP